MVEGEDEMENHGLLIMAPLKEGPMELLSICKMVNYGNELLRSSPLRGGKLYIIFRHFNYIM